MNRVIVGVGSNIDPWNTIRKARDLLSLEQHFLGESQFIQTKPIGLINQPDFVNGAFCIETSLSYEGLRTYLKTVENRLGRIRGNDKYGPRTIDLDIIAVNGEIRNADYYERDFVKEATDALIDQDCR